MSATGRAVDLRGATAVQIGDEPQMHLHLHGVRPPWWTRSGYIEQVRDIAPGGGRPGGLQDRDRELAELAGFCAGGEDYLWWKAGPWAGKSALLSTFVLNPPPHVDVVAFFVTARLAAQSDSAAFTDALLDQLSAIVGETVPGSLSPALRDAHRRALLRAAAEKVHGEGRRLLLVVDGLDEDRGGQPGSGLASVASLLPKVCDEGLQVVVASRPDPRLPADVPADHPLRGGCRIRELAVSEHATRIAESAGRELHELLGGDQVHRDVLGLITACGGGLTLVELEELTGLAPYVLDGLLGGVFGRTVAGRTDQHSAESLRMHLFTHETLRETAASSLGTALGAYRDRLHAWAARYRARGWPEETPQYLLRGYPRMVADIADTDRLVALAADAVRHDRMLDLSGGDAAALAEIKAAQGGLLARAEPDLLALARLAIHRADLEARNSRIPTGLPAVWAELGQRTRAESLAHGITEPTSQGQALAEIARVVAAAGDIDRAESIARSVAAEYWQSRALADVVQGATAAGELDCAEAIARTIEDPYGAGALADVVRAVAEAGDLDRAEAMTRAVGDPTQRVYSLAGLAHLAGGEVDAGWYRRLTADAERLARDLADPDDQASALAGVAQVAAAAGDVEKARRLIADAEGLARTNVDPVGKAYLLDDLARVAAAAGDVERARQLAADALALLPSIADPGQRAGSLDCLLRGAVVAGVTAEVEALVRTIVEPEQRVNTWRNLIYETLEAGDPDRCRHVIAEALADPAGGTSPQVLVAAAHAVSQSGDEELARRYAAEAEEQARAVAESMSRADALADVARLAVALGEPDRAEAITRTIDDLRFQASVLTELAQAAIHAADLDRARRLAADAHTTARAAGDGSRHTLLVLASVATVAGDFDRAEAIARTDTDPGTQAFALTGLAHAAIDAGDLKLADRLVTEAQTRTRKGTPAEPDVAAIVAATRGLDQAETIARSHPDPGARAQSLVAVAGAAATAGDVDRALRLVADVEEAAQSISNPLLRTVVLTGAERVAATAGDFDRAEAIVRALGDPALQVRALVDLARAEREAGDPQRADRLTTDLEALAVTAAQSATGVAEQVAAAGNAGLAEVIAGAIGDPALRTRGLAGIARVLAGAGNIAEARRLASEAERIVDEGDGRDRDEARIDIVRALIAVGDIDRAEALGRTVVQPGRLAQALVCVAEAVDASRARRLIAEAFVAGPWQTPLYALAKLAPPLAVRIAAEACGQRT